MRRLFLMCLAAVLLTAGMASAVVWNPTDPNAIAAGYSNWNIAANWGGTLPDTQGTATFNVAAPKCWVTGAQSVATKFVMGDGGVYTGNYVTVKNGGTLSLGGTAWHAVGYSRGNNILTIEKGGKITSTARILVGRAGGTTAVNAPSSVIVDGGTLELTAGALQMGEGTIAWSQLFVKNDGLVDIKASNITQSAAASNMLIDVGFGTIILNGNQT
ncbi:MAG: hypothetical protein FJ263_09680, partial [Planctomycetes bacterium]|nr:hypothetical protein [Planctomycetota bacterium]